MTYLPDDPNDWQWLTQKNLEVIPYKDGQTDTFEKMSKKSQVRLLTAHDLDHTLRTDIQPFTNYKILPTCYTEAAEPIAIEEPDITLFIHDSPAHLNIVDLDDIEEKHNIVLSKMITNTTTHSEAPVTRFNFSHRDLD